MASKSTVELNQCSAGKAVEEGTKGAVIVVVGGSGGLSERYRAIIAERGLELRHFENRVPNGARRILGRVAAVIVMVGMVSHALRDQVKALVPDDTPVVYLRRASISALRGAVASLDA
ncbi:MAG TPA: DUF2325 domain-containing protein [Kofleriaceae bacterium]|jgi:hypothetical protein|nr:DUF2325 domain-containing protein [Kofleriaceae bacterium]